MCGSAAYRATVCAGLEADWQRSADDEQMELYSYMYIRSIEQALYRDQFYLSPKLSVPLNPINCQASDKTCRQDYSQIQKSDQPRTYGHKGSPLSSYPDLIRLKEFRSIVANLALSKSSWDKKSILILGTLRS